LCHGRDHQQNAHKFNSSANGQFYVNIWSTFHSRARTVVWLTQVPFLDRYDRHVTTQKTDRQITNRLNVDAIFSWYLAPGAGSVACRPPSPAAQSRVTPAIHSDCRCMIPRDRVPVDDTLCFQNSTVILRNFYHDFNTSLAMTGIAVKMVEMLCYCLLFKTEL